MVEYIPFVHHAFPDMTHLPYLSQVSTKDGIDGPLIQMESLILGHFPADILPDVTVHVAFDRGQVPRVVY